MLRGPNVCELPIGKAFESTEQWFEPKLHVSAAPRHDSAGFVVEIPDVLAFHVSPGTEWETVQLMDVLQESVDH
jgi:hypothetical protein